MKTKNMGFWVITALAVSMLAAPAVHSQTERFSASLSGAGEVPPINTAGTADFQMTIHQRDDHLELSWAGLSATP